MTWEDLSGTACLVFTLCVALLMLVITCALRVPDQRFHSHEARVHCGRVCEVKSGATFCVMPCPGPRCLCVQGADNVWHLDGTIGDDENDDP